MMFRTSAVFLSKRMTIPRLSPTHTKVRIVRFEVEEGQHVHEYDPIMVVECSPDLVTPAFRDYDSQAQLMMIDAQEVGVISGLRTDLVGKWLRVDQEDDVGFIDDGEEEDGNWMWQAYLHTEKE